MNIVITGSRSVLDMAWVESRLVKHFNVGDTMINGACRTGVDAICENWARNYAQENQRFCELELMPADWETHGRSAGPIRNKAMVEKADIVLAFWDGKSRGTKSTIEFALAAGVELHVYVYAEEKAEARKKVFRGEVEEDGTLLRIAQ